MGERHQKVYNNFWGCSMQHSDWSSYYCIESLKVTKGVDLKSSHQASRTADHTETEEECRAAGWLGESSELSVLSLCLAPCVSSSGWSSVGEWIEKVWCVRAHRGTSSSFPLSNKYMRTHQWVSG